VPAFAEAIATVDAPVVARLKAAGAIPLARTNLPEMGLRISTDNPLRGRTYTPWDRALTAGGSSGGEGAALATGMSPLGLGNDIGGSLRNPAYCCGITSLKPTVGRIPMAITVPAAAQPISFRLMAVEGPMARSVTDLRIALKALAGWHPRDPFSVPAALEGPPVPKKAALVTQMPFSKLPEATATAIRKAGRVLEESGWAVEEVPAPELARVNEIWAHVINADLQQMLPQLTPIMTEGPVGMLRNMMRMFDPTTKTITEVFTERDRLAVAWSEFFQQYPVVIGPIWADLPFAHDEDLHPQKGFETTLRCLQFITPGNALGIPSVALPIGVTDGLPTGVQVYAERWREDVALDAAELIESRVGRITPIDPTW
jgi:amidase